MLIEARIGRLEILVKDLDEKNEKIFKVLNEFELFFNEFGNQNQENSATQVINAAREKRLQEIVNLGERYFEYQIFIIEYQEKLQEIDDAAKNVACWCSKKPIGSYKHWIVWFFLCLCCNKNKDYHDFTKYLVSKKVFHIFGEKVAPFVFYLVDMQ